MSETMTLKQRHSKKETAIWLFAGGPMQDTAARRVRAMGYKLILTDINPDCSCGKYADAMVPLDTFDIQGNLKAAESLQKKYDIKAVFTVAADCHESVARVGKFLGVHAIDPEISRTCRYKNLSREKLHASGIPQPRFKTVDTLEHARIFIKELGGQAVIKATNNSGSRGFALIQSQDELDAEVFERALLAGTTGKVLVEEVLRPAQNVIGEQSVETLWYNGKMYWLNWVDRLFRSDFLLFKDIDNTLYADTAWGVELGHINPALHPFPVKKSVFDLVQRAGVALGLDKERGGHIFKADIMLTDSGPYILEVTPRLSGGWDSSATTPSRGADFIGGVINLSLGEELDLVGWHAYFEYGNASLFASVFARISQGAIDNIGRKFALGVAFNREYSIRNALNNLVEEQYVIPVE